MNKTIQIQKSAFSPTWATLAYIAFTLSGILLFSFGKNPALAVGNFGIAIVFDPFDQKVRWDKRPTYQKVVLLVHLVLTLSGFVYLTFFNK